MRYAMGIDLDACVGCQACVAACKEQWDSGPGAARDWVRTVETGRRGEDLAVSFYPGLCMQCEDHPCTDDCPTGATYADLRTGVVMVDAALCIGCGSCVSSCPYGARHVDQTKGVVEKCNLCAPFVARGEQPACVATCPAECRVFGDLDDPSSPIAAFARRTGARPLATAEVDVRPKTLYAGDAHRARILAGGAVRPPRTGGLARAFGLTRHLAREAVPAVALAAVGGGALVNLAARRRRVAEEEGPRASAHPASATHRATLPRHRAAVRALHWANALSWLVLLATGTALMATPRFALLGGAFPRWLAGVLGGGPRLLGLHVVWGLAWAALTVPLFLVYKGGPRAVLREVRLTADDLRWLALKPLAMIGRAREPLPPQDRYNAGQKLFALAVLTGTSVLIASGLVMAFHLGPASLVAASVVVHALAIALILLGLAAHLTMAVIVAEERPALRAMVTGEIDREFAAHHAAKWVAELEREGDPAHGAAPREKEEAR